MADWIDKAEPLLRIWIDLKYREPTDCDLASAIIERAMRRAGEEAEAIRDEALRAAVGPVPATDANDVEWMAWEDREIATIAATPTFSEAWRLVRDRMVVEELRSAA